MLFHTLLVVFLALGLPSSYHAQDINDVKKSLHQSRSLEPAAETLTKQERAQLQEALKQANVPVDVDELSPDEQKKLVERIGFSLPFLRINATLNPTFKLGKPVQLGNNWLVQLGKGSSGSVGGSVGATAGATAGGSSSVNGTGSSSGGGSVSGGGGFGGGGSASGWGGSASGSGGTSTNGTSSGGSSTNGTSSGGSSTNGTSSVGSSTNGTSSGGSSTNGTGLPDYGNYDYGSSGSGSGSSSGGGGGSVSWNGGGSNNGGGSANGTAISSVIGNILRLPIKIGTKVIDTIVVVGRNVTHPVQLAKNVLSRLGLNNSTLSGPIKKLENILGRTTNGTTGLVSNLLNRLKNGTSAGATSGKNLLSNLLGRVRNGTSAGATSGKNLLSNLLGRVRNGTSAGASAGKRLGSNLIGTVKNVTSGALKGVNKLTSGITNFTRNLLSNGLGGLKNLGNNVNSTTSGLLHNVRNVLKNVLNNTSGALANKPIRRIVVVVGNTTRGLVTKALVLVTDLNPVHWIRVLFNRTGQAVNNANNYIQNYWNTVLPKLTNNSAVAGILAVKNATNQYLVVTTNAIIGVTNTSANGVANYATNFVAKVANQTQIAYGKMNNAGTLFITTTSNSSNVLNSLYALINGTLVPIVSNLVQGGGMAWNQNNTKFYVVDSGANVVYSFDVSNNGSLSNQTVFYNATNNPQYGGVIKDVAVDKNGNVWLLMQPTDGSSVYLLEVNPNTGNVIAVKSTAFSNATGMTVNPDGSITVNGKYASSGSGSGSGSTSGGGSDGISLTINSGGSSYTVGGSASGSTSGSGSGSSGGSFSFNP